MPIHETDQHREAEERVAREFAEHHGAGVIAIAAEHPRIDRLMVSPFAAVIAGLEVKTASYRIAEPSFGGGYKCAIDKMSAARDLKFALNIPTYLVVEFADALIWLDMLATPAQRGHEIHRADRGTTVNAVMFYWKYFTVERIEPAAANRLVAAIRSGPTKAIAADVTTD